MMRTCIHFVSECELVGFVVLAVAIGSESSSLVALIVTGAAVTGGESAEDVLQNSLDGAASVGFVWVFNVVGLEFGGVIVVANSIGVTSGQGVSVVVVAAGGVVAVIVWDVSNDGNGSLVREVVFVDGGCVIDGVNVRVVSQAFQHVGFRQFGGLGGERGGVAAAAGCRLWRTERRVLLSASAVGSKDQVVVSAVWIVLGAIGFLFLKLANVLFRVGSFWPGVVLFLVKLLKVLLFFILHLGKLLADAVVVAAVAVATHFTWSVALVYGQFPV